jgi:multidrug resistance efflux pump
MLRNTPSPTALAVATSGLFALLLIGGCGESQPAKSGKVQVRRGKFELVVTETCEFKPLRSYVVLARSSGKIDWIVPEGTVVKPGDLIFSQDRTSLQEWLTRDSNELEAARKSLKEVQRQVQMERDELRLEVEAKESAIKLAMTRMLSAKAGASRETLVQAQAALRAADTDAQGKTVAARAAEKLCAQGFLSGSEAQREKLAAKLAAIALQRRKLQLKLLQAGAGKEVRKIAELQLQRARVALTMTRADISRREANLESRVSDNRARVASLSRSVARARRAIAARKVKAHAAGVVIYRNMRWRRQSKPEVGSRIWTGAGVVDVADLSRMKVRTQLAERHIRYLKLDSRLKVTLDPLPDAELSARISWIDRWSRDRSADLAKADREKEGLSGVKVFAVEAQVLGSDLRIKPGFKGKARFTLVTIPDALIVPCAAVFGLPGEQFVMAADGKGFQRVPVDVTADDGINVAVQGKLTAGQELLTRDSM